MPSSQKKKNKRSNRRPKSKKTNKSVKSKEGERSEKESGESKSNKVKKKVSFARSSQNDTIKKKKRKKVKSRKNVKSKTTINAQKMNLHLEIEDLVRWEQLKNSGRVIDDNNDLLVKEEEKKRILREWQLYIACRNIPDSLKLSELNNFLSYWNDELNNPTLDKVLIHTSDVLQLINEMKAVLEAPPSQVPIYLLKEIGLLFHEFREKQQAFIDSGTYNIIKNLAEISYDPEIGNFDHLIESKNVNHCLWGNIFANPSKSSAGFEKCKFNFHIPEAIILTSGVYRLLNLNYDHYSDFSKTFYPPKLENALTRSIDDWLEATGRKPKSIEEEPEEAEDIPKPRIKKKRKRKKKSKGKIKRGSRNRDPSTSSVNSIRSDSTTASEMTISSQSTSASSKYSKQSNKSLRRRRNKSKIKSDTDSKPEIKSRSGSSRSTSRKRKSRSRKKKREKVKVKAGESNAGESKENKGENEKVNEESAEVQKTDEGTTRRAKSKSKSRSSSRKSTRSKRSRSRSRKRNKSKKKKRSRSKRRNKSKKRRKRSKKRKKGKKRSGSSRSTSASGNRTSRSTKTTTSVSGDESTKGSTSQDTQRSKGRKSPKSKSQSRGRSTTPKKDKKRRSSKSKSRSSSKGSKGSSKKKSRSRSKKRKNDKSRSRSRSSSKNSKKSKLKDKRKSRSRSRGEKKEKDSKGRKRSKSAEPRMKTEAEKAKEREREEKALFIPEMSDNELNLRNYVILGGIYDFRLLKVPIQEKERGKWFVHDVSGKREIEDETFTAAYIPPPPPESSEVKKTPEEMEREAKKQEEELLKLVNINMELPDIPTIPNTRRLSKDKNSNNNLDDNDLEESNKTLYEKEVEKSLKKLINITIGAPKTALWFEPPVPVRWDAKERIWDKDGFYDVKFNEYNLKLSFGTDRFGIFGLAHNRWSNLPYQSWELRPAGDNKVTLSLLAAIAVLEFTIENDLVCVSSLQNVGNMEVIQEKLVNKYMRPKNLIKKLRLCGLDVFPESDSYSYVDGILVKDQDAEDHLYECMALVATAFNFQWSRWNLLSGRGKMVYQMRERLGSSTPTNYLMVLTTRKQTSLINCTEVSPNYSEEQTNPEQYNADLLHLINGLATGEAKSKIKSTSPFFVESLRILLTALKPLSFS